MKTRYWNSTACVAITLILPAAADTIYSGLLDTTIPTTFTGTTVLVGDGTLNPFFGGVGVANNNLLQPGRVGTGNLDAIVNFGAGATIDSGLTLDAALGYGGSFTHLGTGTSQFQIGQTGYLGFKLDGADYGWMRVIFTNNTGGAVIKDWAYDNGGGSIATGNVLQSGSTITLDSTHGSFALGSALTGPNSVVKDGAGTTTLKLAGSYSGGTTVFNGTLLVNNSTGSGTGSGAVTVASGATLGGTGSIAGPVTINGGILSPGASIESLSSGTLTFTGGTFKYEMDSSAGLSVAADFQKVFGDLSLSGTVTLDLTDLAVSPTAFAPNTTLSLINYAGTWNGGYFTCGGTALTNHTVFTAGLNTWQINYTAISGGLNFASEYTSGHFVTLTAVPEPGSWLAIGCLVGSGAFLRRRHKSR